MHLTPPKTREQEQSASYTTIMNAQGAAIQWVEGNLKETVEAIPDDDSQLILITASYIVQVSPFPKPDQFEVFRRSDIASMSVSPTPWNPTALSGTHAVTLIFSDGRRCAINVLKKLSDEKFADLMNRLKPFSPTS